MLPTKTHDQIQPVARKRNTAKFGMPLARPARMNALVTGVVGTVAL